MPEHSKEITQGNSTRNEVVASIVKKMREQDTLELQTKQAGIKSLILTKGGAEYIINEYNLTPVYDYSLSDDGTTYTFHVELKDYTKQPNTISEGFGTATVDGELVVKSVWDNEQRRKVPAKPTSREWNFARNKAIKMAKKRAVVDAVLSLGFSPYFTQDMDDFWDTDDSKKTAQKAPTKPTAPPTTAKAVEKFNPFGGNN